LAAIVVAMPTIEQPALQIQGRKCGLGASISVIWHAPQAGDAARGGRLCGVQPQGSGLQAL